MQPHQIILNYLLDPSKRGGDTAQRCCSLNRRSSFIAMAVMPNEVQTTAIRLTDNQGFISTSPLENGAALIVTDQLLHKPITVELLDSEDRVLAQRLLA